VPIELRCSPAIRGLGVDPIGSAQAGSSYLLVDLPLPWQHDLSEDPRLDELHAAVRELAGAGHPWRVQATAPQDDGARRIVAYERPTGPASGFLRRELAAGPGDEVAQAIVLLQEVGIQGIGPDPSPGADLLLCTHGARDICCGGSGTALWKELRERVHVVPDDVRLSRTSHTGGHRFAPTAVLLPEGTTWAWLDAGLVRTILQRDGEVAAVLPHYRGSALLSSMAEQVVERAVFAAVGWTWLDHRRSARSTVEGDETVVELAYEAPDGTAGVFTGRTKVVGTSPVPQCGEPLEAAPKSAPILELVGGLDHVRP
jgi:hypothetical protein